MSYWKSKPPCGVQVDRGHPLSQGLIGRWLLNEGSGKFVNDVSGADHGGTANGGVWTPTGYGQGLLVAAQDITCRNPGSISLPSGTFIFWGAPSSYAAQIRIGGNSVASYKILATTSFRCTISGVDYNNTISPALVAGQYYCFAATHISGVFVRAYVNGIRIGSTSASAISASALTYLTLASDNAANKVSGALNGYALYNRALTDTEVATVSADPYCMMAAPPLARYTLMGQRPRYIESESTLQGYVEG